MRTVRSKWLTPLRPEPLGSASVLMNKGWVARVSIFETWVSFGRYSHTPLEPRHQCRVPHIPDFLWSFVGSLNFMRLSLEKGAHAVLSRAAYRKFGESLVFREMWDTAGLPLKSVPDPTDPLGCRGIGNPSRLPQSKHFWPPIGIMFIDRISSPNFEARGAF
jgi:hypothetical protein